MQDHNKYWTTEDLPMLEEIKHTLKVLPFVDIYRDTIWHFVAPVAADAKKSGNDSAGIVVTIIACFALIAAYLFTQILLLLGIALILGILSIILVKNYNYLAQNEVTSKIYILTAQYFYHFETFAARQPYKLIKKVQLSNISALRTQTKSLAIYTDSLAPFAITLPTEQVSEIKKIMLFLHPDDIIDADIK